MRILFRGLAPLMRYYIPRTAQRIVFLTCMLVNDLCRPTTYVLLMHVLSIRLRMCMPIFIARQHAHCTRMKINRCTVSGRLHDTIVGPTSRTDRSVRRSERVNTQLYQFCPSACIERWLAGMVSKRFL